MGNCAGLLQSGSTIPFCGGPGEVCFVFTSAQWNYENQVAYAKLSKEGDPIIQYQARSEDMRFYSCIAYEGGSLDPILPAYEDLSNRYSNGISVSFWDALKENTDYKIECCDENGACQSSNITTGSGREPHRFSVSIVEADGKRQAPGG